VNKNKKYWLIPSSNAVGTQVGEYVSSQTKKKEISEFTSSYFYVFFVVKTDFHFTFSKIKNSYAEKRAVFAKFHKLLSPPSKKNILDRSYCICPLKTALFVTKTSFHFIFSVIKNSYRKKCYFRRI